MHFIDVQRLVVILSSLKKKYQKAKVLKTSINIAKTVDGKKFSSQKIFLFAFFKHIVTKYQKLY